MANERSIKKLSTILVMLYFCVFVQRTQGHHLGGWGLVLKSPPPVLYEGDDIMELVQLCKDCSGISCNVCQDCGSCATFPNCTLAQNAVSKCTPTSLQSLRSSQDKVSTFQTKLGNKENERILIAWILFLFVVLPLTLFLTLVGHFSYKSFPFINARYHHYSDEGVPFWQLKKKHYLIVRMPNKSDHSHTHRRPFDNENPLPLHDRTVANSGGLQPAPMDVDLDEDDYDDEQSLADVVIPEKIRKRLMDAATRRRKQLKSKFIRTG